MPRYHEHDPLSHKPGFVSINNFARKVGVTPELVRVWIKDGKLSAVQPFSDEPKGWHLIPLPEAERFIDRLASKLPRNRMEAPDAVAV